MIYIDHGAFRKSYLEFDRYIEDLDSKPWILFSTIPITFRKVEDFDKIFKIIDKWLRITASVNYVESIYVIINNYVKGVIDKSRLVRQIINTISEKLKYIEDLYATNIVLKLCTGYCLPDLDILVVYEDPLSIEQGRRVGRIELPNIILRKRVETMYESKITKKVEHIELEITLIRKRVKNALNVVDFSNLGMYPYTGNLTSIDVEGREVADHVLCTYLRYGVDIRTTISNMDVYIVHYRYVNIEKIINIMKKISKLDISNSDIVVLPQSMTNNDVQDFVNVLKRFGYNILSIFEIPLDILFELFQNRNTGS